MEFLLYDSTNDAVAAWETNLLKLAQQVKKTQTYARLVCCDPKRAWKITTTAFAGIELDITRRTCIQLLRYWLALATIGKDCQVSKKKPSHVCRWYQYTKTLQLLHTALRTIQVKPVLVDWARRRCQKSRMPTKNQIPLWPVCIAVSAKAITGKALTQIRSLLALVVRFLSRP